MDPTGQSYNIVISSLADSSGYGLDEGDEIGIFDGSLCVGVGVYHDSSAISISVWTEILDFDLPGFIPGHLIQYRYFNYGTGSESMLDALPD